MTAILGISAFYHDSAAALLVDGKIVAAAAEERFTRRKHDSSFPEQAIAWCLAEGALRGEDLDFVGYYEKPLLKFDRLLETYLAYAPRGYRSFRRAMPRWLSGKQQVLRALARSAAGGYRRRIVYAEHHESHAASAFYPSPFEAAAILTVDGVGEWSTATIGIGRGNRIEVLRTLRFPHSLGLLYSAFTAHAGFEVNEGEYKLMGLAPYGKPVYRDHIVKHVLDMKEDGSIRLDMQYFDYCAGASMTSRRFEQLLGVKPRHPHGEITQAHKDLAASIQAVTEEVLLRMARYARKLTGMSKLVMAGGVALNCVANERIAREAEFDDMWVQPAAGDDGGALGVAMLIWHHLLGNARIRRECDNQRGSLLGPAWSDEAIRQMLDNRQVAYETAASDQELCDRTAALLAEGQVIGWFQGPMEYGPRALGNRSILADPRDPDMQSRLNRAVKNRESFRPFAPAVLAEQVDRYFDASAAGPLPYMLLTARCLVPEQLPAVTHVDGSSRVQTVHAERYPLFHRLLTSFEQATGCPVLVNTSFNVRSEPIVCTPDDAYRCFLASDIQALVMGRQMVSKAAQPIDLPSACAPLPPVLKPIAARLWGFTKELDIPWTPTGSQLRRFLIALPAAVAAAAWMADMEWTWIIAAAVFAGAIAFALHRHRPAALAAYRAAVWISIPAVLLIAECLLAGTYYLVLTPLAWALRLACPRPLTLRADTQAESCWEAAVGREAIDSYFRPS